MSSVPQNSDCAVGSEIEKPFLCFLRSGFRGEKREGRKALCDLFRNKV